MTDKPCKRLSANATKEERDLAHIVKMGMKRKLNEHNRLRLLEHSEFVFANLSKHHENYGETPAEQFARMAKKSS